MLCHPMFFNVGWFFNNATLKSMEWPGYEASPNPKMVESYLQDITTFINVIMKYVALVVS